MTARPAVLGLLIICVAAGKAGSRKAKCPDPEIFSCTLTVRPVCGSNGQTYGNECLLCKEMRESNQKISIAKNGHC
ncbi:serine protease inhibitor Kazal-type 1-like isoform X2 [Gambusia affinis]|uniref:serine protease inhibitor Kazal-type 1-like isoform X2 n=1 Tax=Gambusia affinis TaxID=33528 RepID=UPI001CDB993B|nr:serine protease inhibitor Kazal-type 1-like isoform X2 [Gambusia affinis]